MIKTFLRWYEMEVAPDGWKNPIRFVHGPHLPENILEPVSLDDIKRMLRACSDRKNGLRARAILSLLIDTGMRVCELVGLELGDANTVTGAIIIRMGKGQKSRMVFMGRKTRRAVRAWIAARGNAAGRLLVGVDGGPMNYWSVREVVRRLANRLHITHYALHGFRRAFALNMLRSGVDLITLQRLLGHSDMSLLKRYIKQTDADLRAAVAAHSVVDTLTE